MRIQQSMLAAAFMFVSVLGANGIASAAEEESEMTPQQNCEQEAKQAGMTEAQDIQEYVAQCLAEAAAQKNPASEAESGT
jgi:hypothetical protein